MADEHQPYKVQSLRLSLTGDGTSNGAAPEWRALAYLSGAGAFCELVESCCIGPTLRREMEEAAELYARLALREVREILRRQQGRETDEGVQQSRTKK